MSPGVSRYLASLSDAEVEAKADSAARRGLRLVGPCVFSWVATLWLHAAVGLSWAVWLAVVGTNAVLIAASFVYLALAGFCRDELARREGVRP